MQGHFRPRLGQQTLGRSADGTAEEPPFPAIFRSFLRHGRKTRLSLHPVLITPQEIFRTTPILSDFRAATAFSNDLQRGRSAYTKSTLEQPFWPLKGTQKCRSGHSWKKILTARRDVVFFGADRQNVDCQRKNGGIDYRRSVFLPCSSRILRFLSSTGN